MDLPSGRAEEVKPSDSPIASQTTTRTSRRSRHEPRTLSRPFAYRNERRLLTGGTLVHSAITGIVAVLAAVLAGGEPIALVIAGTVGAVLPIIVPSPAQQAVTRRVAELEHEVAVFNSSNRIITDERRRRSLAKVGALPRI